MKRLNIAALTALLMASCAPNPFLSEWDTPYGIPDFGKIKVSDYLPAVKKGIELQNGEVEAIVSNPEAPTFENTVVAFDRSGDVLGRVCAVLFNISESDATPRINSIVEKAMPLRTRGQPDNEPTPFRAGQGCVGGRPERAQP